MTLFPLCLRLEDQNLTASVAKGKESRAVPFIVAGGYRAGGRGRLPGRSKHTRLLWLAHMCGNRQPPRWALACEHSLSPEQSDGRVSQEGLLGGWKIGALDVP